MQTVINVIHLKSYCLTLQYKREQIIEEISDGNIVVYIWKDIQSIYDKDTSLDYLELQAKVVGSIDSVHRSEFRNLV